MNHVINRHVTCLDLGIMEYGAAWDYQARLFEQTLALKTRNRQLPETDQQPTPNYLLFCEHPHVYTLGKSGDEHNLLLNPEQLTAAGISYFRSNRGGDITYHGPGQIVVYPVLDLENFFTDIHRYMRTLEESVILTLQEFGVNSGRIPGLTGVWLDPEDEQKARKICALGVKTSRWVTMHGLAFNVNTQLEYFQHIIPCGIRDKSVTSLSHERGHTIDIRQTREILKAALLRLFEMTEVPASHTIHA